MEIDMKSMKLFLFTTIFFQLHATSKLIVMRHAQALNNVESRYNSNPAHPKYRPAPLTKKGRKQAEKAAQKLQRYGINKNNVAKVYVSPLPRTMQTAQALIHNDVASADKFVVDNQLIERSAGIREGQRHNLYDEFISHHKNAHTYGGETDEDVHKRMQKFYNNIEPSLHDGTTIVVTHSGPARELLRIASGKPVSLGNADFRVVSFA